MERFKPDDVPQHGGLGSEASNGSVRKYSEDSGGFGSTASSWLNSAVRFSAFS
eukprot:CAMPEP_0175830192 /NCGR_PEP_ID=MMETSP0107_2-20121207/13790_1 /TAXON_ID=195067 ORGANISM="Goniomonas pacifica, Strain CCMP1869" /NCGR_SAMPLE_ID=MMETSP0107_2 /ASSEMBLY_ACC=CAM_ASM_000203 /LENGTH=52 /DNA_ID=CAMNT_0017143127 /DNA_START=277 /DNA_END=431 /DNA_ORIENTATION=+